MFDPGSIVTLNVNKEHREGEETLYLKPGTCGMVTDGQRNSDGNHTYTVNFGPYGGWYCRHSELNGNDPEVGWDGDREEDFPEPEPETGPMVDYARFSYEGPMPPRDDQRGTQLQLPESGEEDKPRKAAEINAEADIARRVKELERGKK